MAGIKSLAKDTAVYGLSSIIGRFLNWCLVPLYTTLFAPGDYGVVTFVYTVVALALIVLTTVWRPVSSASPTMTGGKIRWKSTRRH